MKAPIDQIIIEEVTKAVMASEAQCQQQHEVYMKAAMDAARAENERLATDTHVITVEHNVAEFDLAQLKANGCQGNTNTRVAFTTSKLQHVHIEQT